MLIPLHKRKLIRDYLRRKTFYDVGNNGHKIFEVYFFDWADDLRTGTTKCTILVDWDFIEHPDRWVCTFQPVVNKIKHIITTYFVPGHPFRIEIEAASSGTAQANLVYRRILWRGRINYILDHYQFLTPAMQDVGQPSLFYKAFNFPHNGTRYMTPDYSGSKTDYLPHITGHFLY